MNSKGTIQAITMDSFVNKKLKKADTAKFDKHRVTVNGGPMGTCLCGTTIEVKYKYQLIDAIAAHYRKHGMREECQENKPIDSWRSS